MVQLVIVESPAKCKKIASFLGPDFQVLATMGHIRALEEDLEAVGIDRDFEPRFRFLKEKAKATKPILDAAAKATTIYLAADDDREGEAIAYGVACLLKKDPLSFPRAVFHEITATAVRAAVANPRKIDMNRVYAQQARAVLDMLVGFTISPLLWKHVARSLSAGRCQTPALRLVSDREKEITSHTSQTTWGLSGIFGPSAAFTFEAKMDDEIEDQESALNYLENIHTSENAVVSSVDERPWIANPPKPLITSTLQQEASALYKMNPKSTMKIAQTLYEAGHITYMRTDHAIMSEEAIKAAQEEVQKKYGDAYVGTASSTTSEAKAPKKPKAQEAPQAQEAHEAIRPTHFELAELPAAEEWTPHDKKIYTLIHKRATQSVMSPARGLTRTVKIALAADADAFPWSAQWKTTTFAGWQILGQPANLDDSDAEEDKGHWKEAQKLTKGTPLKWQHLQAAPKRSRAAPRYTEATLIRDLEKRGIGRPSTFASLVEVLFDKNYIEKKDIEGTKINHTTLTVKPQQWPPLTQITQVPLGAEKQKLVPSVLGESVIKFCLKEFPHLFAYEFTAQMENRLDRVAKGEEPWKGLCRDTWTSYNKDYDRLKDKASLPSSSEKVRDFGGGFKAVMSKTGPLLLQEPADPKAKDPTGKDAKATFYSFPPTANIQTITEQEAREWIQKQISDTNVGLWDGKPILKKKGPYGQYLECGTSRIPYVDSDTLEQILVKFRERGEAAANTYKFGPYTFGKGQYGPYMYKTDLKTKIFVGIPSTLDPKALTGAEADALYKAGVEAKKAQGARGGRGGRGGATSRGGRGGRPTTS
jgi:DNA topoisomerase-1